ncbi:tRNA-specific adenosine deaminase 2 [Caerostris darwini]|uniref:tRNA-specific adenosine deaminase 2 n=1 Tax=Caerostris darwini TaxID=1538125 RepID=A0AAV4RJN9_9ARAC|nr:tRNA-specific adenosine deaminase 2 [Caerostris darwini]
MKTPNLLQHLISTSLVLNAEEGLQAREVPVGCIMLYKSQVIASSRNTINETKNATRHAEINCIDQVIDWCKKTMRIGMKYSNK